MSDILSNTTNLSNLVPTYYSKRLLERLEPNSRAYMLAEKRQIPANSGNVVLWNRYVQLDEGANLTEGTIHGPSALSTVTVSATLTQYGNVVKITDMVEQTAISNVVRDAVDVLADNAAKTIDKYILNTVGYYVSAVGPTYGLSAAAFTYGFPLLYSVTSGSLNGEIGYHLASAVADGMLSLPMSVSAVRQAVTHLRTLNVSPHEDGFYHALVHPTTADKLRGHTDYIAWNRQNGSPAEQSVGNKFDYMLESPLRAFITEGVKIWKMGQSAGKTLREYGSLDSLKERVQSDCTSSEETAGKTPTLTNV